MVGRSGPKGSTVRQASRSLRYGIGRSWNLRPALVFLAAVLALSVACRKWDNPLDPIGDHPPTVPSHPSPADSSFGLDTGLVLSWQSQEFRTAGTRRISMSSSIPHHRRA